MRTFTNIFATNSVFGISQNRCVKMIAARFGAAALHLDLLPRHASLPSMLALDRYCDSVGGKRSAGEVVARLERMCSSWSRLQPCWQPARRGSAVGRS